MEHGIAELLQFWKGMSTTGDNEGLKRAQVEPGLAWHGLNEVSHMGKQDIP